MGLLELQGAQKENTKWNILAHSGTWTHDPWIAKPLQLPLGYGIWYTIGKLKLIQLLLVPGIDTS